MKPSSSKQRDAKEQVNIPCSTNPEETVEKPEDPDALLMEEDEAETLAQR